MAKVAPSHLLCLALHKEIPSEALQEICNETSCCSIIPQAFNEAEIPWILKAQQELHVKYKKGEHSKLSPFVDKDGVMKVGGRIDTNIVSYEMTHPALLPKKHWISLFITRYMPQSGHNGGETTAAKSRVKYWIQKVHDLAKLVKFKCKTCREMAKKMKDQLMSNVPTEHLSSFTPAFQITSCDYFGPCVVKISRNKIRKRYGVLYMCLNTRAVHLEVAADRFTMEFMQVLRRFFSIRGQPVKLHGE